MQSRSTMTCPHCGNQVAEAMPTDACQFFYDCKACGEVLRPLPGDCCVFCSYGSEPCPPIQAAREGGAAGDCCAQSFVGA
ncbi:MAG: hypothetical protein M3453_10030 [Pseudomonadota bacterium]|nr:hypothetical protein [Pseudomonadota bacterium]